MAVGKKKVLIGVMGVTGAGKSTFIKIASQLNVDVGHDLLSCTSNVDPYTFVYGDYEITLIDTPGFNDTFVDETTVLKNIAEWLYQTYRHPPHQTLNGIIYMQSIEDRKMYGSTLRNLKMFRELCGDDPLKNVILVTTGWGSVTRAGNLQKATDNELQLRTLPEFWANMIARGSDVKKFEDTRESALKIIFDLVDKPAVVLQIQDEMVNENKDIADTAAGHVVEAELQKVEAEYRAKLEELEKDLIDAKASNDKQLQDCLEVSRVEMEKLKADARQAQEELHYANRNQQRRLEQRIEDFTRDRDRREQQQDLQLKAQREQMELQFKAQQIEERLQVEGIIAELQRNEWKIRDEERRYLLQQIDEIQRVSRVSGAGKSSGTGKRLLLQLTGSLGAVAMSALGFPLLTGGLGAMGLGS